MTKLNKRIVDAAEAQDKDYVIWDDELPGFGLRVFTSGKRSYLIQYRSAGRSRRYTIGQHGVWTPELARKEAKIQLGRVAQGDNPAEERQLDHKAITVKELCDLYFADLKAGLILGKGGRPKKASTITTDTGRINRHIVPLIGTRRVKDLIKADVNKVLKDIMAGKTRVSVKTKKLRGKAIVRGGVGTATRTVGLLGGILTYAVDAGIIETNPAHGIRKPKDRVRNRRLIERTPESQTKATLALKKANILSPTDEGIDFEEQTFTADWYNAVAGKLELEGDEDWLSGQVGKDALNVALDLTRRWQNASPPKIRKPPSGESARPNGRVLRTLRKESDGLLLIYPVMPPTRVELEGGVIEQTELDPKGPPIIGIALSFPVSATTLGVEYRVNTVWGSEINEDDEYED